MVDPTQSKYWLVWCVQSSGPECLPKQTGDRTECALLQFVLDLGVYYPFIRKEHPEETFVKVFGFSPERRFMSTVIRDGNEYKIYIKGAPEAILPRCTGIFKEGGKVAMFTLEDRGEIDRVIKNMQESSHLKVMCIAQRPLYPSGELCQVTFFMIGSGVISLPVNISHKKRICMKFTWISSQNKDLYHIFRTWISGKIKRTLTTWTHSQLTECIYLIDTDLVLSVYTAVVTWQTLRLFIVIITIAGRSGRATVGKRRGNNIRDDVDWTCRYRHSGWVRKYL